MNVITEADTQKLKIYSDLHWSQKAIASELHLPVHVVRRAQKELLIEPSRRYVSIGDETETEIVQRLKSGESVRHIACSLNLSWKTVGTIRDSFGLGNRLRPAAHITEAQLRILRRDFRSFEQRMAEKLQVPRRWISRQLRRRAP